jgi:hypothetical protein
MYVLGTFLIRVITVIFLIGMAGSVFVVAISFFEDFRELFGPDEPGSGRADVRNPVPPPDSSL